ncbi:MAG: hypothetical protein Q8K85_16465, partial [Hyphomicrobium sp.]|nr:hypothetical protein [Hyphomicrobium sp.]
MIWRAERPEGANAHRGAQFTFAGPERRTAGAETGRQSIGLSEDAGPFERFLLEILHAVGWRGEQRRL